MTVQAPSLLERASRRLPASLVNRLKTRLDAGQFTVSTPHLITMADVFQRNPDPMLRRHKRTTVVNNLDEPRVLFPQLDALRQERLETLLLRDLADTGHCPFVQFVDTSGTHALLTTINGVEVEKDNGVHQFTLTPTSYWANLNVAEPKKSRTPMPLERTPRKARPLSDTFPWTFSLRDPTSYRFKPTDPIVELQQIAGSIYKRLNTEEAQADWRPILQFTPEQLADPQTFCDLISPLISRFCSMFKVEPNILIEYSEANNKTLDAIEQMAITDQLEALNHAFPQVSSSLAAYNTENSNLYVNQTEIRRKALEARLQTPDMPPTELANRLGLFLTGVVLEEVFHGWEAKQVNRFRSEPETTKPWIVPKERVMDYADNLDTYNVPQWGFLVLADPERYYKQQPWELDPKRIITMLLDQLSNDLHLPTVSSDSRPECAFDPGVTVDDAATTGDDNPLKRVPSPPQAHPTKI